MKKDDLDHSSSLLDAFQKFFQNIFPTLPEKEQLNILNSFLDPIIYKPNDESADSEDQDWEFTFEVGTTLQEMERIILLETLRYCKGDKTQAAKMLGVCEKTIYNLIRYHKLHRAIKDFGREKEK